MTDFNILQRPLNTLKMAGFLKLDNSNRRWKKKLGQFFFIFTHIVFLVFDFSHVTSTLTRSIRHLPEFMQRLLEDLTFNLFYFESLLILYNYNNIQSVMRFAEVHFSVANKQVIKRLDDKLNFIYNSFFVMLTFVFALSFLEPWVPIHQEETELLRYIYQRNRPERRLPTNFWIPFADDSESWTYEVMYTIEFYLIFLIIMLAVPMNNFIPMFITHAEGQYIILSEFVEKIGHVHRDKEGKPVMYTNMRKGTFRHCSDLIQGIERKSDGKWIETYERLYVKEVVQFHQMLLIFRKKVNMKADTTYIT